MQKLVLDTSFLYSFLNPNDANHKLAQQIFWKPEEYYRIIIPYIVITEMCISIENTNEFLHFIKNLAEHIEINTDKDLDFIGSLDMKDRRALKANDCLVLAVYNRTGGKLLTFDKKLQKMAQYL